MGQRTDFKQLTETSQTTRQMGQNTGNATITWPNIGSRRSNLPKYHRVSKLFFSKLFILSQDKFGTVRIVSVYSILVLQQLFGQPFNRVKNSLALRACKYQENTKTFRSRQISCSKRKIKMLKFQQYTVKEPIILLTTTYWIHGD